MIYVVKRLFAAFPWMLEILKYGLIGSFSALIDITAFYLMRTAAIPLYAANFFGINIGILISFLLNARFTFKKSDKMLSRGIKFFCIGYCGLLLSMGFLYLGVEMLGVPELIIKISSVFIIACIQFLLNKFISFK